LRSPIDRTFPLADAAEAHRVLEAHPALEVTETGGKMLLMP
jgi:hypothetical protein